MPRILREMERLKTFMAIIWMLVAMMVCELGFLVYQIRPESNVVWITIALIAITFLWMLRIAFAVIKELRNKHKQ